MGAAVRTGLRQSMPSNSTTPATKHEHVPAERVLFQFHLNHGAQPGETTA